MTWAVRKATAEDVPRLQEIEVDAGRRFVDVGLGSIAHDHPPESAVLLAHIDSTTAWVAESDGVVVGYAIASVVDDEGHLDQISVVESHGGRGIGAALVEQVEAWTLRQGLASLTLTTFEDVPWNGPWYARLGFEPIDHDDLGPGLRATRERETAAGIDVSPRTAMRKSL